MYASPMNRSMFSVLKLASILLISLLSTGCPTCSMASFYYVSTTGDDAAEGTLDAPWKTLSKASAAARAGETVFIRESVYNERLLPENAGTSNAPIIFTSYPGETAVIDGTGINLDHWWALVQIWEKDYVEIRDITVRNSNGMGIAAKGASGIVIDGCTTLDTFVSGILCNTCSGIEITNNLVIRGAKVDNSSEDPSTTSQECISVQETSGAIIARNTVRGGKNEGIDLKGGCSDSKVFDNHIYDQSHCGIYIGE